MRSRALSQLLLMQSFLIGLPDEKTIMSFVCRGLSDIPGVAEVHYIETDGEQEEASIIHIPIVVGETSRGGLSFTLDDPKAFEPYLDYLNNFCYMLAVILEERRQRKESELWQSQLEARVQERTGQLETEIAERHAVEASLRESEERFRALVENLPVKVFIKDNHSVYLACNPNYAKDIKIDPEDIQGKTDYDFFPKDLAEKYRADDRRIMEWGHGQELEEEYTVDGRRIWIQTIKTPLVDEAHNVTGILGVFWDITERKRAEAERTRLIMAIEQLTKA